MKVPENLAGKIFEVNLKYCAEVPSVVASHEFLEGLVHFLFPIKDKIHPSLQETEAQLEVLMHKFYALALPLEKDLKLPARSLTEQFFTLLPEIYTDLLDEADSFVRFDPAAWSVEEVMLCYPGFFAISVYRIAHVLYELNVPILPRIMAEYAHSKTGIDIHPGAQIGKKFFIDHGTGVVIGETTLIGNNVKIYQGVTLGALHVEKGLANTKRHPTIEDNVIIYAGSTILGGKTVVGHDTIIGGNVFLTNSVEPYTIVYHKPQMNYRTGKDFSESLNFVI